MRAVRLEKPGSEVVVSETEEPKLRAGGAIVRIEAAHVPSFMGKVLAGELDYYDMPLPFIPGPGAVGVVEEVAEDVPWLAVGTRVFLDIDLKSHTPGAPHDHILIGLTSMSPKGRKLQSLWRDGTYAERVCYPAECLTPVGEAGEKASPAQLAALNFLCIGYGALLGGGLRPGQVVAVNGATGNLGASVVLSALAMGAARVVAVARERGELERLSALSSRVVTVAVGGEPSDADRIREAAGGFGPELVVDALGNVTAPEPTLAGLRALRQGGTAVLCGGVFAPLALPYLELMVRELTVRGVFMYPRTAPGDLLRMIAAGTLKLSYVAIETFPLTEIGKALAAASGMKGLRYCMVQP